MIENNRRFTETHPYTFDTLCANLKKFKVPAFQRAYAWTPKQINDFWESLTTSEKGYFIGNLVFLQSDEETDNRYTIIDGQQRLLTISLLLCAIKEEYGSIRIKNEEQKERIKESQENIDNILFFKEPTYPFKKSLRLLPGKDNLRNIYSGIIDKQINLENKNEFNKLDNNQKKFVKNYSLLRKLLEREIGKGDKFDLLDHVQEKAMSLLFIVIVCASDNDAYEIFEGLNSTGISLTVADLVKNAILKTAKGPETSSLIESKWEELERLFEQSKSCNFTRFLRHQWISQEGYITTSKLFAEIKKNKLKNKESSEIIKYATELLEDAKSYIAFREEEFQSFIIKSLSSEEIFNSIRIFRYLDIEQVYELLLAHYNKLLKNERYTKKQFINDLNKLWIFSFRAKIMSVNPSDYERIFAEHCLHIKNYKKEQMDRMSKDFHKKLANLVKNDDVFIEKFQSELDYRSDRNLITYILEKIIQSYEPNIKITEPTIEHILPQDPKNWGLSREKIQDYVNTIGNLTLLHKKDNQNCGNLSMNEKSKKIYKNSHFKLNRKLATEKTIRRFTENPEEVILKRGLELSKEAAKIWTL